MYQVHGLILERVCLLAQQHVNLQQHLGLAYKPRHELLHHLNSKARVPPQIQLPVELSHVHYQDAQQIASLVHGLILEHVCLDLVDLTVK